MQGLRPGPGHVLLALRCAPQASVGRAGVDPAQQGEQSLP